MSAWPAVANEELIATPALLIFRERVDANLRRMIEIAGGAARLRPHVKTHKMPEFVKAQIALGITKFKTATIAETEMCAQAGAKDILLAYQTVGPGAGRLCALARLFPNTQFGAIVDNEGTIRELSRTCVAAGVTLGVMVDLECGMGRTGIAPGDTAIALYRLIASCPGLRAAGLHAYDGHVTDAEPAVRTKNSDEAFHPVLEMRAALEASGLSVPALVAGGTPTFPVHAKYADRECSPGTTVLWDFGYGERYTDLPFEIAAVLLTRVVSHPGETRICLDLGHKAVAAENPLAIRARILEIPDAVPVMHSEEHLVIETPRAGEFAVGQTLHALPRHICPTVALHAEALIIEGGKHTATWPIAARARRLTV